MKLGFIGLGIMGAPMAGHLLAAGHELFAQSHGGVPAELQALNPLLAVAQAELVLARLQLRIDEPETVEGGTGTLHEKKKG